MGGAVAFDTLEFVETLKVAGVPDGQAKAFATAVRKSQESSNVATKQDIKDLRREILEARKEVADVKSELHREIVDVKSELHREIADVKSELHREVTHAKYDLLKWFVGFFLTNTALLIGVLFKMLSIASKL